MTRTPPTGQSRFSAQPQKAWNLCSYIINKYLLPAPDQQGFRPEHSTTSALLQLTTDIAMGFNQWKSPYRTVCVAQWPSCYLWGRQAKSCFRGVKLTNRKVNTGVPKGSKLSSSMVSFYNADMPRPADPVKRVCYIDDLTVWASGVNISDQEVSLNNCQEQITAYLKDNVLLIPPQVFSFVAHPWYTPSQYPL